MSTDFDDFTRENYRRLLRLAKHFYACRLFSGFSKDERFILWRHDLDFSVQAALKIARIEAEEGVCATYFLYPHSRFYNLLERENKAAVSELASLGHAIGLHFDTKFHGTASLPQLESQLADERLMLRAMFGIDVSVFSFHDTDAFTDQCRQWSYSGLVNTYADYFRKDVGYVSDSNGIWRHRRLEDVLTQAADRRLQVLTHPAWWQDEPMSPRERVERCIAGRARSTGQFYDTGLSALGRPNVGR